jgi:pseudaminic acid synthase
MEPMMSQAEFSIRGRKIGPGEPVYVIAELSANHNQDLDRARELIDIAASAGADAVKLQTYTPDTITLDCRNEHFQIKQGTLWEGRNLHDLYREAMTPWAWQPLLIEYAESKGLQCFSSVFDATSVDFLEEANVAAYKVASFELVDLPLLRKVAGTAKPVILSTGMATLEEIDEAVEALRSCGPLPMALLRTNSAYPADPSEMNLRGMPELARRFDVVCGLSDHTLGVAVPVAAVGLGASIIEKHITFSRDEPGPDSAFSLEPDELVEMISAVRVAEQALGTLRFGPTAREQASLQFRRSLFVALPVAAGEAFTFENVRSVRPAAGLHTRHLDDVVGRRAARDIELGTPLSWELVEGGQ